MRQYHRAITEISPAIPMGGAPEIDSARLVLSQPWQCRRLLWVDDSRMLLALYKSVFESLGFEVLATSSPAEALQRVSSGEADMVILDYEMPAMDGGTLASLVKDRHPMLPVILYSASTSIPSSAHYRVDAICEKGAPREELLATIERLALMRNTTSGIGSQPFFTPSSNH
jgi:CheY-like chemotaxis protein